MPADDRFGLVSPPGPYLAWARRGRDWNCVATAASETAAKAAAQRMGYGSPVILPRGVDPGKEGRNV